MKDSEILRMLLARDEGALKAVEETYGRYCYAIAFRLLGSEEDAEECVNDTYLAAWNSIPPMQPGNLATYLGKLTRRISLNRLKAQMSVKRGGGVTMLCMEELEECLPDETAETDFRSEELSRILDGWLREQNEITRYLFIRRYWHCEQLKVLADRCGISESKAKTILHRGRLDLKRCLEKEGVTK